MRSTLNMAKWTSLILGVLSIIAGCLLIYNPAGGILAIVVIVGILFIALGIMQIIRYFSAKIFRSASFLITGILDIILGIVILRYNVASTLLLVNFISFWVLIRGIIDIASSIDLKRLGFSSWWLALVNGILGIILGIIMIGAPGLSTVYVIIMSSIYLFTYGIMLIVNFASLTRISKNSQNIDRFL